MIDIKYNSHFKLYVLLKDKIIFENKLNTNGIQFYTNLNEQPEIGGGIRYFLLDSDREKIDKILIESDIIATTETIPIYDYRDQQKIYKVVAIVTLSVIGILILVFTLEYLLN